MKGTLEDITSNGEFGYSWLKNLSATAAKKLLAFAQNSGEWGELVGLEETRSTWRPIRWLSQLLSSVKAPTLPFVRGLCPQQSAAARRSGLEASRIADDSSSSELAC